MIYIASPYSHKDPAIMQQRAKQVAEYTAGLVADGKCAISPIVNGVAMVAAMPDLPHDFAFWQTFCLALLSAADELIVLQLEGWETSTGVQAEIAFAVNMNIPVKYVKL